MAEVALGVAIRPMWNPRARAYKHP